jgi:dihydrofolate synthase/folylpolyglutamate synthase
MSFFEMTVGLAFEYFEKKKVDIAIIEVGMGGRLDATNIITPLISVITNIGLDHTPVSRKYS